MLKVAVGVISNQQGDILISQRASNVHQAGLWEFPGGKIEKGETTYQALKRELLEELNIHIDSATPFINIEHEYNDLSVCLDVYRVDAFHGIPEGMEKQPIKWVAVGELDSYAFPTANLPITRALTLSPFYPIVDDSIGDEASMSSHLDALIAAGYSMIQLRATSLDEHQFKQLAMSAVERCKEQHVRLFVNTTIDVALAIQAKYVHLNSQEREKALKTPASLKGLTVATSCHCLEDLEQAKQLGCQFAVLSPVCKTQTHADAKPLGWEAFSAMVKTVSVPVYALGGVGPNDEEYAKSQGAFGVSGIRGFYKKSLNH